MTPLENKIRTEVIQTIIDTAQEICKESGVFDAYNYYVTTIKTIFLLLDKEEEFRLIKSLELAMSVVDSEEYADETIDFKFGFIEGCLNFIKTY